MMQNKSETNTQKESNNQIHERSNTTTIFKEEEDL